LQGDNIVSIANSNPKIGVIPHNIRNNFTRFRRRMHGQFNVFHKKTPCMPILYHAKRVLARKIAHPNKGQGIKSLADF
jgi:hypothetical protein